MPRVARPLAPPIVVLALVVLLALALPVALAAELLLLLLEPLPLAAAVLVLLLPPITTFPCAFDPLWVFVALALVLALELCVLLGALG